MAHSLYFDRTKGTIYGVVSLIKAEGNKAVKVFSRLPARSGSFAGSNDDWIPGRSPIPFGHHWMNTAPVPLWMEPKGTPFFLIGSEKGTGVIIGPNGKTRTAIGLHLENNIPGSAGCIVLEWDTTEKKKQAFALFSYLKALKSAEPFVEVVVL